MKSKEFKKKLELNKKTITDLSNRQMNVIHGGLIICTVECPKYYTHEFHTCNCTFYCSKKQAGCPTAEV